MSTKNPLAAVVLTHNEAINIRYCLESIKGLCDIYVVDSGSDDATVEICREYTQHIYQHSYRNHASQWQWALDNLPIQSEWILALDADFTVTPELRHRLTKRLSELPASICGIYVRHLYVFGGSVIRFGGTKRFWLRIVRRGRAKVDTSDLVDFRFVIDDKITRWPEAVIEYNRLDDDISTWLIKQDKFSLRLAVEEELRRLDMHHWQIQPKLFGTLDERYVWLRERWLACPLYVRPFIYFVYRYILAGGFLDGRGGFLYHVLQGFWLRLIVDWKITQLRAEVPDIDDLRAFSERMLESKSGSVHKIIKVLRSTTERAAFKSGEGTHE